jgi:hypothetical protein
MMEIVYISVCYEQPPIGGTVNTVERTRRVIAILLAAAAIAACATVALSARGNALRGEEIADRMPEPTVRVTSRGVETVTLRFEADDRSAGREASALVRVPDTGVVEWEVHRIELGGPGASEEGPREPLPDLDQDSVVHVSEPAIMRDLRVVRVTFSPTADLSPGAYVRSLDVTVRTVPGTGVNEKRRALPYRSPEFERLYESTVVNFEPEPVGAEPPAGERDPRLTGARYLVISRDSFASTVWPLVKWKHEKGVGAKLVTLSETGYTAEEIRSYIVTAYNTWDIPPEYVLLVGDTEALPTYYSLFYTDNYYAAIDGEDYLADVLVGRLSADTITQCNTQVAKFIGYERTNIEGQPGWPTSGLLTIAVDHDAGDWVYYLNTWYIYNLMDDHAFAPIDTLFDEYGTVTRSMVYSSVNAGKGFINFRGQAWTQWPYPFDIDPENTTSGWRLPIVVSATCGTGRFDEDGFICERWVRAGSASYPRGGVAFFATGTAFGPSEELSLRRGYVDQGFFAGVFTHDLDLGGSCLNGKTVLYQKVDDQMDYEGWNLLGDPEMNVWTATPYGLTVLHDGGTQIGASDFTVTVLQGGELYEGARVACVKGEDVFSLGYTDASGQASVPINPATPGTLSVVVTDQNMIPYRGEVLVLDSGPFIVYEDIAIDDSATGNDDTFLNPGETVDLSVALSNVGDESASSVTATFRTPESCITIVDSVASYGELAPQTTGWGLDAFEITVAQDCPAGRLVPFSVVVDYGGPDVVTLNPPPFEVVAGRLVHTGSQFDDDPPGGDGDGLPGAGETVGLSVTLENDGPSGLADIQATLTTDDPYVVVTSGQASFGDAPAGWSVGNPAAPFVLSVSPTAISGYTAPLSLVVTADGHSFAYVDTVAIEITLTAFATDAPTGPDAYGYYAYDTSDGAYGPAPVYDWTDIAPPGPGSLVTEITDEDAAFTTRPIFFGPRYYGEVYNQISLNSNGFITMGWSDYLYGDNSVIPSAHGPAGMIAGFWDDLDPSAGGDIYTWLDATNHRYIIQFDEVRRWGTMETETFQIIILNENYYPTPTNDAPILIQYEHVANPTSCTVGIENPDQTDGIGWLFDGTYGPQAAPVADGEAILFTTVTPVDPGAAWLVLDGAVINDGPGGDDVPQPGETIELDVGLRNEGGTAATDVTLTLSSADPAIAVTDSTAGMQDVPAGGSRQTTDPFVFDVTQNFGDGVATLWVLFEANGGGYTGSARIDLEIDLSGSGVDDEIQPSVFSLSRCAPNPFGRSTAMSLTLPSPEAVSVRIYSPAGRLVRTIEHSSLPAGEHSIHWDGTDNAGSRVASGVYFMRVEAGPNTGARKVVLLR